MTDGVWRRPEPSLARRLHQMTTVEARVAPGTPSAAGLYPSVCLEGFPRINPCSAPRRKRTSEHGDQEERSRD